MVMVVLYPVSATDHSESNHGLSSILTRQPGDRKDILSIILLRPSCVFECGGSLAAPPNHETDMAHKLVRSTEIILGSFQKNTVVLQYENVVMDDLTCEFFTSEQDRSICACCLKKEICLSGTTWVGNGALSVDVRHTTGKFLSQELGFNSLRPSDRLTWSPSQALEEREGFSSQCSLPVGEQ